MRYQDIPAGIRTPLTIAVGLLFGAYVFVIWPVEFIDLNAGWGWPRVESGATRVLGAVLILAGILLALNTTNVFARFGRGTPVPIDPPRHFIADGLYRYSRNPMYVGYVAYWLGLFLFFGHLALLLYAVLCAAGTQLIILFIEEPGLRRRFGESYVEYTRTVPRWLW